MYRIMARLLKIIAVLGEVIESIFIQHLRTKDTNSKSNYQIVSYQSFGFEIYGVLSLRYFGYLIKNVRNIVNLSVPLAQSVEHRPFHTEEESIFQGGELSVKHSFPR